jgi:hypothetical protein
MSTARIVDTTSARTVVDGRNRHHRRHPVAICLDAVRPDARGRAALMTRPRGVSTTACIAKQ